MTIRNFFSPLVAVMDRITFVLIFTTVSLGLTAGCGQAVDGPERFDVSGKVNYNGEPVPVGTVRFLPDASKGNSGPAGFAAIKEGKYDTATEGRGTVGGPHEITVIGFDGQVEPDSELTDGRPLFSEYRMSVELSHESAALDIEIPSAK